MTMDLSPPWGHAWAGRLDELVIDSEALTGNALGDPHRRPLYVYTPPGYDDEPDRRYPSVYVIQGLTGQLDMWRNAKAFTPTALEAVDDWFATDAAAPAIVVYVDAWTSLGGSQFVDSPATGRYHTYLCDEVVPFVDGRYRTLAGPAHRGIAGKSSGGYGAMITPMLRPDLFGGLVTHAGDALFEAALPARLPRGRSRAARRVRRIVRRVLGRLPVPSRSLEGARRRAPERVVHGRLLLRRRRRHRAPAVRAADRAPHPGDLGSMAGVGPGAHGAGTRRCAAWPARHLDRRRTRDEYYLDLGAEAFRSELDRLGVADDRVRFELFDGTHAGIDWRYPEAIGWLAERLSG